MVRQFGDAAGIKLKKEFKENDVASLVTTDYVGGGPASRRHYKDGTLEFFQHSEGRVLKSGSSFAYEFNLTDHLGNVRVTVNEAGSVVQRDDYYPFGLTFNHWNTGIENFYKLTGNEEQPEIQGVSDFNARFYDASLGRFMMIDPLADAQSDFTPYHFGYNSPIALNDPSGLMPKYNWKTGNYEEEDGSVVTYQVALSDHGINPGRKTSGKNNGGETSIGFQALTLGISLNFSELTTVSANLSGVDNGGFTGGFLGSWSGLGRGLVETFSSWDGFTNTLISMERSILNLNTAGIEFDNEANEAKLALYNAARNGDSYAWGMYGGVFSQSLATTLAPEFAGAGLSFLGRGLPKLRFLTDISQKTIFKWGRLKRGEKYITGFQINNRFRFQLHKHRLFGSESYLPHANFGRTHIFLSKEGIRKFGFIYKGGK